MSRSKRKDRSAPDLPGMELPQASPLTGNGSPANFPAGSPRPNTHWKEIGDIARGSLGSVHLVELGPEFQKKLGKKYAVVKKIQIPPTSVEIDRRVEREKAHCARMGHPNIIKYFTVSIHNKCASILMELMSLGSLTNIQEDVKKLEVSLRTELSLSIGLQIFMGLAFLHHVYNMIHRDVKLGNVLIGTDGRVKLCDFDSCTLNPQQAETITGTEAYIAPEVFMTETMLSDDLKFKRDIWSTGVVMFAVATGEVPFKNGIFGSREVNFSLIESPGLRALLKHCLDPNVNTRYSATQAIDDEVFTTATDTRGPLLNSSAKLEEQGMDQLAAHGLSKQTMSHEEELTAMRKFIEKDTKNKEDLELKRNLCDAMKRLFYRRQTQAVQQTKMILNKCSLVEITGSSTTPNSSAGGTPGVPPAHMTSNQVEKILELEK